MNQRTNTGFHCVANRNPIPWIFINFLLLQEGGGVKFPQQANFVPHHTPGVGGALPGLLRPSLQNLVQVARLLQQVVVVLSDGGQVLHHCISQYQLILGRGESLAGCLDFLKVSARHGPVNHHQVGHAGPFLRVIVKSVTAFLNFSRTTSGGSLRATLLRGSGSDLDIFLVGWRRLRRRAASWPSTSDRGALKVLPNLLLKMRARSAAS
ncbi:hypothetical protein E2C01_002703 [Portunus trituberculatus]|uniref:Uncharacterized protein n=1 Tax=Portunus trituberculatus TaxID=210409 RepID=A0A5B7CNX6_PORTR|nr:hypothetical protein [Portunus trituberculatus]